MPSLVLEATWAAAGGSIIIYVAALLGVPGELYDAAEVDGASIWRKIWHVTLPQLRGVLFVMLILQVIATAQVFLEPFLFTGGGPGNATVTVLLLIYRYAFQNSLGGDYGEATALSVMLAIVLARAVASCTSVSPNAGARHDRAVAADDRERAIARRDRGPRHPVGVRSAQAVGQGRR